MTTKFAVLIASLIIASPALAMSAGGSGGGLHLQGVTHMRLIECALPGAQKKRADTKSALSRSQLPFER
jgi:hypothetical protein